MKELKSTVQKTFALLEHFTPSKPEWGVTEMATHIGSNKSTVYRFFADLEKMGILYKNESLDKYSLGLKLFELGSRVMLQSAFIEKTHPILEKVADKIKETVHLAILKNKQVFYVDKVESPQGLKISSAIGSFNPLHSTALGKVLLANLSSDKQKFILDSLSQQKKILSYTPNTIVKKSVLNNALASIKERGYAIDREEFEIGLVCLAIPIYNDNNEVVASLSASGPSNRFREEEVNNYVCILKEGALDIQSKIGLFKPK